jgi:hypothetical protein
MILLQALTRALKNSPRLEFGSFTDTRIFKFSLGVILLMLFSFQSYGQTEWTFHLEMDGVKAYSRIAKCNEESVVFLKFVNSNSGDVTVSWDEQMKFQGSDSFEKVNPMEMLLSVSPGEIFG